MYTRVHKEIGSAPIDLRDARKTSCMSALEGSQMLPWHGDTLGVPPGAELPALHFSLWAAHA